MLVFQSGALYQVQEETQEVGAVDADIIAAKWSPNEEYLALATEEGELYMFTAEWDVLYKVDLDDGDQSMLDGLCDAACISWHGNSQLLQVCYQCGDGFKCLTRDATNSLRVVKGPARSDGNFVFSVAEAPVNELKRPIAFMPNGSLTAGFVESADGPQIAFWEKNCLRHGEFNLPAGTSVIHLDFSADSSILAVVTPVCVYLCVRSNWAWQVKQ